MNNVCYTPGTDESKDMSCYDTIDTLPHLDHYRNIFSLTSPESKSRPTLEALHETGGVNSRMKLASTFDVNSDINNSTVAAGGDVPHDVKPKTDIVKFGWIIGVLVC